MQQWEPGLLPDPAQERLNKTATDFHSKSSCPRPAPVTGILASGWEDHPHTMLSCPCGFCRLCAGSRLASHEGQTCSGQSKNSFHNSSLACVLPSSSASLDNLVASLIPGVCHRDANLAGASKAGGKGLSRTPRHQGTAPALNGLAEANRKFDGIHGGWG